MFEKLDKTDWKVLDYLLDNPMQEFHLRAISKNLEISPSSSKKAIDKLLKLNLINETNIANLRIFKLKRNNEIIKHLKIAKNIQEINNILEKLKPAISIILYGSKATGTDIENSDIDVCIITNAKKKYPLDINSKKIQIVALTPSDWNKQKTINKAYYNEVQQGILLYGEMPK